MSKKAPLEQLQKQPRAKVNVSDKENRNGSSLAFNMKSGMFKINDSLVSEHQKQYGDPMLDRENMALLRASPKNKQLLMLK